MPKTYQYAPVYMRETAYLLYSVAIISGILWSNKPWTFLSRYGGCEVLSPYTEGINSSMKGSG